MIVPSKASRGCSGKYQSALLTRLQQEGFDTSIELPFTCEELSCWLIKDAAGSLKPDELITAIKVAHFVEADVTPWARPLSEYLFSDAHSWQVQQDIWANLDQLSGLDGVTRSVFRSSRLLPEHMLPFAPHKWHPAVVHSKTNNGRLDASTELLCDVVGCAHKLSEIRTVVVDMTGQGSTSNPQCWRTLLRLPELRHLEVTVADDDDSIEAALRQLIRLTSLHILEDAAAPNERCLLSSIAAALPCLQQLRELVLPAFLNPSEHGVKRLAAALPSLSSLRTLHTPAYSMRLKAPNIANVYYAGVASCAKLVHLHISGADYESNIVSTTAGSLGSMLPSMTALTELRLTNCADHGADVRAIALGAAQLPHLHTLHLSSPGLSLAVCMLWAPQLATMQSLRSLDIRYSFGRSGVFLAQGLEQLTALTFLAVTAVSWAAASSSAFATALARMRCLRDLRLCGSGAAQDGAAFGAALAVMSQLTSLRLHNCCLCQEGGMEQLAAGLGAATALQFIDLSNNDTLNDEFAAALAQVLPQMPDVTSLNVSCCDGVTSDGCAAVLQAAAQTPKLRALDVLESIALTGVEQVLPLLPHLRALPRAMSVAMGSPATSEHVRSLLRNALAQRT